MTYFMRINERRSPPIVFQPPLRIRVSARGSASFDASGQVVGGAATASVTIGDVGLIDSIIADAQNPLASFDRQIILAPIFPGDVIPIRLAASAGVSVGQIGGSGSASAFADPLFTFDEEGFAEYARQQGFEPFLQSDYYEFEFSPNVAVPEPNSLLLAALTAPLYLLRRRTKRYGNLTITETGKVAECTIGPCS